MSTLTKPITQPNLRRRWRSYRDVVRVLVIGNNPIELGEVHDHLETLKDASYKAEFAFSLADGFRRAVRFKPHMVILDDNLSEETLSELVAKFKRDKRTTNLPFALLKTDNYKSTAVAGFKEFMLKKGLTADRLSRAIQSTMQAQI